MLSASTNGGQTDVSQPSNKMSKPKYRASVDANQKNIVRLLNEIPGVSVLVIGEPVDLLVAKEGDPQNYLIEIKDGRKKSYERKSTPKQAEFLGIGGDPSKQWPGQKDICISFEQVMKVLYS